MPVQSWQYCSTHRNSADLVNRDSVLAWIEGLKELAKTRVTSCDTKSGNKSIAGKLTEHIFCA